MKEGISFTPLEVQNSARSVQSKRANTTFASIYFIYNIKNEYTLKARAAL